MMHLETQPSPECRDAPRAAQPLLTVIVPAHNEEATIDGLLRAVVAAPYDKQVIIVNDGSTDATEEIAACWAKEHGGCEVLRHRVRRGKGAAIRTGLGRARGQYTIIQDADLEYDPAEYPRLLDPLLAGDAQVVYGSRYLAPAIEGKPVPGFRWGVSALNVAVQALYGAAIDRRSDLLQGTPYRAAAGDGPAL